MSNYNLLHPIDKTKLKIMMHYRGVKNYKDLALWSGIPYATIQNITCSRYLSIAQLYLLADCLDCKMKDLVKR